MFYFIIHCQFMVETFKINVGLWCSDLNSVIKIIILWDTWRFDDEEIITE